MPMHPAHQLRRPTLSVERPSDIWKVEDARSDYMTQVSHDARNLLSALVSNIDWLRTELDPAYADSRVAEGLADVETCCERLTGLLEDALLATRPEGLRPQLALVGIGALAQAVLRRLRRRMEAAGVVVELTTERDVPVLLDRFLLARVFERLTEDALHMVPQGTRLLLAHEVSRGAVELTLAFDASCAVPERAESDGVCNGPMSSDHQLGFCELTVKAHGGSVCTHPEPGVLWRICLPLAPSVTSHLR